MLRHLHRTLIHSRRVRVLATHLAELIPRDLSVLDVGSGDGRIAAAVMELRPDLKLSAIDTTVRENAMIPTAHYDGKRFPFEAKSVDVVMMIDVLHHVEDIDSMLAEAARVSRKFILIKDHFVRGRLARQTLTFMDHVSNRQFGIAIPANYQTVDQWNLLFANSHLRSVIRRDRLGLYVWPLSWIFERKLHFMQLLAVDKLYLSSTQK